MKTHIWSLHTLSSITLLIAMLLGGNMKAWGQDEKVLYTTDFQDWEKLSSSNPEKTVDKLTSDKQTLTFSLYQTEVNPTGWDSKFSAPATIGCLRSKDKDKTAYIKTSALKSITTITFVQAATGNNRGWGLKVKGDGDADWVTLDSAIAKPASGHKVTVSVDRKNVQLWFYSLDQKDGKSAFMTELEIKGIVEAAKSVTVSYYDTDGTTLIGEDVVDGNSALKYKYGATDVTTGSNVFRGWFNGLNERATKVREGEILFSDISLYAKATPKEEATFGSEYTYDMTKEYWYVEDHELIDIKGATYSDPSHGWLFETDGTIKVQVARQARINLTLCNQTTGGTITVLDENGNEISSFSATASTDATVQSIDYSGSQGTLTLTIPKDTYIHGLTLYNYKPVYVSFKFPNDKIEGTCPSMVKANMNNEVTMPTNQLFARNGWTFQGWSDGTNLYEAGKTYVIAEDVTLTAKVSENTIPLAETNSPITVTWAFDYRKAPVISLDKVETPFIYNNVITVEGEKQDIALKINASSGKVTNTDSRINDLSNGAEGAQVNTGTVMTVPAVYGMSIIVHGSDKVDDINSNTTAHFGSAANDSQITLGDYTVSAEDQTISDNGKTLTLIYRGDATSLPITFKKAGTTTNWGFYKDITVVYPVLPNVLSANVIEDADPTKFPNEKAENAGKVTIVSSNLYPNTGSRHKTGDVVTVTATPDYGYNIKGYRVKGTDTLLPTKEVTTEAGTKLIAAEYTVSEGTATIEAVYTHQVLYKVVISASDPSMGAVSISPIVENFFNEVREEDKDGNSKQLRIESWFIEGTEVTASADPVAGCVVDYWTKDDATDHLTDANSYTFTVGKTDLTYMVHLRLGELGSVMFDISNAHVNGESVASLHKGALSQSIDAMHNVRSFTIPTNYTFFKSVDDNDVNTANAYHLLYWIDKTDNDNRYELGKTYSFKTQKTITLTPVFSPNPTTRTNRVNEPVVRYDFGTKVVSYYDSTSKETRNVCAQEVNIGSNTDTYWTAQAYFETLNNGVVTSHTRDVTMYVNTGHTGYIRNEDLNEWCAFGPGTTFWCTSSVGTTVSIMTYSKITTTTIDGVVPTLNEKRTAEERKKAGSDHIYVYSYTTQNAATTMPIVIGDDYSYYQWIEVNMLAANLVNLHTSVDESLHGKIDNVKSLSEYGATELEDGGHAFRMGDRLRVTFERLFGFKFDKIVDKDRTDANGNPTVLLRLNDDNTVDMVDEDYVMHTVQQNTDGTWGSATGNDKTVFTLKATEPTEAEARSGKRTTYEMEYDITTHRTIEFEFKEQPTYYVTYNPGQFASGIPPVVQWLEEGDIYTIPQNTTLYYEGNTLNHWVDEDYNDTMSDDEKKQHTYEIGSKYIAQAKDIRLFPVFQPNEFSVLDLDKESTTTWHFCSKDGAPTINYERTKGILVSQLYNGSKWIDLKLDLDGTSGKFNNTSSTDRIQINSGSVMSFPSTPNCVAKLTATADPSATIIAGKKKGDTDYSYKEGINQIEVTCSGAEALQKVEFGNGYFIDYMVTYKPQDSANKSTIETLSCDGVTLDAAEIKRQMDENGHITFTVSPWENEDEAMPDITGTATNGGSVSVSKTTILTKEAAATVKTKVGITVETYPVRFEFTEPTTYPEFVKVTVNGVEYTATDNVIDNAPRSGIVKIAFNRTMAATTINIDELKINTTSEAGKELQFKYWDLPAGGKVQLTITPDLKLFKDVYGKVCQQTLVLTLNVAKEQLDFHHQTFDFVVGKDGTMDEAIAAANSSKKPQDERYFIFVPDGEYQLMGNEPIAELGNKDNARTRLARSNVSLIGQSKDGVTIWNKPEEEGISYTGTIHIAKNVIDFYSQDLTLENRFDFWKAKADGKPGGRAVAFWDQGNRAIMKRVALKSWQDTYYSNNSNADYRGYFENSDFYGVVDFLCGDGDIWMEQCNIILRDRDGNNIAAPSTQVKQEWGYVFNNCTIRTETENPQQFKDKNWTLARPWNDSPACTFINTKMKTQPTGSGWGRMNTNEVLRLHEYRSWDGEGSTLLSLGERTLAACVPGAGSDDCVLNAAQADQYTLRNVVGGTDAFEPNELCRQIDAASAAEDDKDANAMAWQDDIEVNDNLLGWATNNQALCYFVFKLNAKGKWTYMANTAASSIDLTQYGSGYYCVRAANQRGGLGAATKRVLYQVTDPYELEIKQLGDLTIEGTPYGWSTICLPFNAKTPEGITVYAATAHNEDTADKQVTDYQLTLTPVEVLDREKGYVVYGPVGKYYFNPTSRTCDKETILMGNATSSAISSANNNGYVLANKAWGLGFYKYTGSTYAPYRAWLPQSMVSDNVQQALSAGTRAIRLVLSDGTTLLPQVSYQGNAQNEDIYNLSGQRITSPTHGGIYISRQKGKFINK